jgi:hypothetical protein
VSWPQAGVSAADITALGVVPGPGAHRQVPIASVAKVMTAYVALLDHPLTVSSAADQVVLGAVAMHQPALAAIARLCRW